MSVAPAAPVVPVTRESFGIPADEDPWSQVPDPTNPLNTARAFFEHFLQDNGGLRKENDGEPRRYANVFFDFRRGRSKYYRDVLGIDNGKVSTLASQDWQLVKSTEYGKKFWKDVADETARLYDTRFPGQRQRQPIYPTLVGNRPLPLAAGTMPSVLAPPLPASPPRNGRPRPPPINIRRRSTSQAQAQSSPSRQRTTSVSSASGASLASPVRPGPRYSPYGAAQSRYSPPGMPVGSSLPTHYEAYSHPSPIYYATSTPVTPLVPVAPPPHVLPTSASHSHSYMTTPPTQPLTQVPSAGSEASYPSRSLSVDTSSLAPPSMQLQRHSLDMGVFAYEGTSAVPAASGAPSWPPATTSAAPVTSPTASYYQMPATSYISHTPAYPYAYTPVMSGLTYDPARSYSPNPACAPVTHIDPTLFAGAGPKWYDHSQGISPTSLAPDLPRTNSTPMLAGDYEGYHAWTPEMQP